MNQLSAVCAYELRRLMTPGRLSWWFVLAGFPVAITLLVRLLRGFGMGMPEAQISLTWMTMLYMLIPCVCCALCAFLNAAPAIAAELEQRSWIYFATRPRGILWLLLGKYLVSFFWAATCAIVSASLAVTFLSVLPISNVAPAAGTWFESSTMITLWWTMVRLSTLSAIFYSALFLLIGALFPKRAMVFCVTYTALVEVVFSLIPAVINRITAQYRLRSLLVTWIEPEGRERILENDFFKYVFAEGGSFEQVFWLLFLSAAFLGTALVVAHKSEFTGASESDV